MVTIQRKKDVEQLASFQRSMAEPTSMKDMIELEKMKMEQEQLRYLQTLRTGKPAGQPVTPTKVEKKGMDVTEMARQVDEMRKAQEMIVHAADEIRPKPNPYDQILNGPIGEGIGQGLGTFMSEIARDYAQQRRERARNPGPQNPQQPGRPSLPGAGYANPYYLPGGGSAAQPPPQMQASQPPQDTVQPAMTGLIGGVQDRPPVPPPQMQPQPQAPPLPGPSQQPVPPPAAPRPTPTVKMEFSDQDRNAIQSIVSAVNGLATIVAQDHEKLASLEQEVALSNVDRQLADKPRPRSPTSRKKGGSGSGTTPGSE